MGTIGKVRPPRRSEPARRSHRPIHRFQALLRIRGPEPLRDSVESSSPTSEQVPAPPIARTVACGPNHHMVTRLLTRQHPPNPPAPADALGELPGLLDLSVTAAQYVGELL